MNKLGPKKRTNKALCALLLLYFQNTNAACVFNEFGSYCHPFIPDYNGTGWAYLNPVFAPQYFANLQQSVFLTQQRTIDFASGYNQAKSEGEKKPTSVRNYYTITGPTDINNTENNFNNN